MFATRWRLTIFKQRRENSPSPSSDGETQTVCGVVESVRFHNEDTGFTVAVIEVDSSGERLSVVGTMHRLQPGEWLSCDGTLDVNPRWGEQLRIKAYEVSTPKTALGIERYLSSGLIKGIGAELAKRITAYFGAETLQVLESTPQRVLEVDGIGHKRMEQLVEAWNQHTVLRRVLVFLRAHGLGSAQSLRVFKTYGEATIECLRQNPYRLAQEVWGIGFTTADRLARALGISAEADARLAAGLAHTLRIASERGHTCLQRSELITQCTKLLDVDQLLVEAMLEKTCASQELLAESFGGETWLFLPHLHRAELTTAHHIHTLGAAPSSLPQIEPAAALEWAQAHCQIQLATSQMRALEQLLRSKVSVLTGGPGVGKTTVLRCLLAIYAAKGVNLRLAAPTGRAAKRMQEATGFEAATIHRLLRWNPRSRSFEFDSDNPLPECDILVVDEASMIDIVLMSNLLAALPAYTKLVLVGDPDQLPSVGPGNLLADLIASETIPTCRLTEVHRQAADSDIIATAHAVNAGNMPLLPGPRTTSDLRFVEATSAEHATDLVCKLVTDILPKQFGFKSIEDVQVLAPMHRGIAGVSTLNTRLAEILTTASSLKLQRFGQTFCLHSKVMQIRNNYDKEVYNGDIGFVASMDFDAQELHVRFGENRVRYDFNDLDELVLAYAISIHKSQGSEYPCVVVPLLTQHYVMLQRNLLYTALTRGKRLVVLVGQRRAIAMAVNNTESAQRGSLLASRVRDEFHAMPKSGIAPLEDLE